MHEEPLHLIPQEMRADIEKEFGVYIEGDLCPQCRWLLEHKYENKIESVPVVRMVFSEKNRCGRPQEPGYQRTGRRH
jgi:serine protein kinase